MMMVMRRRSMLINYDGVGDDLYMVLMRRPMKIHHFAKTTFFCKWVINNEHFLHLFYPHFNMWVTWLVASVVLHILNNNIKSELSVRGAKRDVENIQKCTRLTVSWPHNPIPDLVIMMIMVVVCNVSLRSGFVCRTHGASLIGLREISKYSGFHETMVLWAQDFQRGITPCVTFGGFANNFFSPHFEPRFLCFSTATAAGWFCSWVISP